MSRQSVICIFKTYNHIHRYAVLHTMLFCMRYRSIRLCDAVLMECCSVCGIVLLCCIWCCSCLYVMLFCLWCYSVYICTYIHNAVLCDAVQHVMLFYTRCCPVCRKPAPYAMLFCMRRSCSARDADALVTWHNDAGNDWPRCTSHAPLCTGSVRDAAMLWQATGSGASVVRLWHFTLQRHHWLFPGEPCGGVGTVTIHRHLSAAVWWWWWWS